MVTCRLCTVRDYTDEGMVKYSVRHHAHYVCFLEACVRGEKSLRDLPAWKVGQIPYRLLKRYGLLEVAQAIREDR